jgi:hypothetical protein
MLLNLFNQQFAMLRYWEIRMIMQVGLQVIASLFDLDCFGDLLMKLISGEGSTQTRQTMSINA